jgi:hypothetical protein
MPTEALLCPTCNAADTSGADAHGVHVCAYCGVRYRIDRGTPTRMAATPPSSPARPSNRSVAIVLSIVFGAVAMITMVATRGSSVPVASPLSASPSEPSLPAEAQPPVVARSSIEAAPVQAPTVVEVEPPVPLTGSFELQHRQPSSGTSFYAIGWFTNTSSVAIERPKIIAVMRDDEGAEVGTSFGFTEGDEIAAGARAPVKILVQDPPKFAKLEFEFELRPPFYTRRQVAGLRLEHGPAKAELFGPKLAGKVFNDGTEPARFVQVQVLTLDAGGKLVGVDHVYADAAVLAPGKSTRFELNLSSSAAAAAKYELTVSGAPVE